MAKAVYAGTFDPLTFGHLDIISRAAEVFDQAGYHDHRQHQQAGAVHPGRAARCSSDVLTDLRGVEVRLFRDCSLISRGKLAQVLVRGLRAAADFDYEFEMALMNRELAPQIETVFFVTRPQYMFVSSTLITEMAVKGGDVAPFVPAGVQDAIISKLSRRDSSA